MLSTPAALSAKAVPLYRCDLGAQAVPAVHRFTGGLAVQKVWEYRPT
jgi:hypothetical protein